MRNGAPSVQFQLRDDACIDPDFAAAGDAVGGARNAERRIRDAHMPAQRIARA